MPERIALCEPLMRGTFTKPALQPMSAYAGALRVAAGEKDGWDLVATSATVLPRATRKGRGVR